MQPILDRTSGLERVRVLGRRGIVVLGLLLGAVTAQADTTGFSGDFQAAFWTNQVQWGSVYFTNSGTELVLAGPNLPPQERNSLEGITYNGPLGGGLVVGGTVSFHWAYNSGDAVSPTGADFSWDVAGSTNLANGGPSVSGSGDFTTPVLNPGNTNVAFLLTTDTLFNKVSGTLIISDFQFRDVPEPATAALLAEALVGVGAVSWWRSRKRASRRR